MIELIISLGIVSFLVMYLAFNLDKEHFFLKFFLVGFVFVFLFLMPKAVLDSQEVCELKINNTIVTNNQTDYTYGTYCYTASGDTNLIFINTIGWLYRIFMTYIIVYIVWHFLKNRGVEK